MEFFCGGFWRNWVGNQLCVVVYLVLLISEVEIVELVYVVICQGKQVCCVGLGYLFMFVVVMSGLLLLLQDYQGIVDVDQGCKCVMVKVGIRLNVVMCYLKVVGLLFVNQGDIDLQVIVGVFVIGMYGMGVILSNLLLQVVGMCIVCVDGLIMIVSDWQDFDLLYVIQVNIGMFGVVLELMLQVIDVFWLYDCVWCEDFDVLMEQYDELVVKYWYFGFFWCLIFVSCELYCLFDIMKVLKLKKDYDVCEIKVMDFIDVCMFYEGEYEKIVYSLEVYVIYYVLNFYEFEYVVFVQYGKEVLGCVCELIFMKYCDCIFLVEYCFMKGDFVWISLFYQQDSVIILCLGGLNGVDYWLFLKDVDDILCDYDVCLYWGKLYFMNCDDVDCWFLKVEVFCVLCCSVDFEGVFFNDYFWMLFS